MKKIIAILIIVLCMNFTSAKYFDSSDECNEYLSESNKIPNDINKYYNYLAEKTFSNNIKMGKVVVILSLIFILFSKEIVLIFKKIKLKRKFN